MPLGTELSLGTGDIVLDGDPVPSTKRGTAAPPRFSAHFTLTRSPISATAELLLLDRFRDYQVVRRECACMQLDDLLVVPEVDDG